MPFIVSRVSIQMNQLSRCLLIPLIPSCARDYPRETWARTVIWLGCFARQRLFRAWACRAERHTMRVQKRLVTGKFLTKRFFGVVRAPPFAANRRHKGAELLSLSAIRTRTAPVTFDLSLPTKQARMIRGVCARLRIQRRSAALSHCRPRL